MVSYEMVLVSYEMFLVSYEELSDSHEKLTASHETFSFLHSIGSAPINRPLLTLLWFRSTLAVESGQRDASPLR
jgi:hypothetical protein